MSKTSIIEKFAQDAINAPALVTGGGKACKAKSGSKNKAKSGSKAKSGNKAKSGSKNKNTCVVAPPCKY